MDPNTVLDDLRKSVSDYEDVTNGRTGGHITAEEICILFKDLDGWLQRGGFLPDAWSPQA